MSENDRQWRQRLRREGRAAVELAEMRRLGFWPADTPAPGEAALDQTLEALRGELRRLLREDTALADPEEALGRWEAERRAAARARRAETRRRRAETRHQRALVWARRRREDVVHLGAAVSGALGRAASHPTDRDRLRRLGLPEIATAEGLAEAMGVALGELRFLAYDRAVTSVDHYARFRIPKRRGGTRRISAPKPRLKRAQYWILDNILAPLPTHPAAHGFVPGQSPVTNAAPHAGRGVVVNLDLREFFPSIGWRRVRGAFRGMGYGEPVATLLALLCTEAEREAVLLDGALWHVAVGERVLPQGAPTSPALTNRLCRRLDARLAGAAAAAGFAYTRYADDLTFSASAADAAALARLLGLVRRVVREEGFQIHPDKTRIMRSGARQEVTGLVVNQRPRPPRAERRRLRAALHRLGRGEAVHWPGAGPDMLARLAGWAAWWRASEPEAGGRALARLAAAGAARAQGARRPEGATGGTEGATGDAVERPLRHRRAFRRLSARGDAPWLPWWQPRPVPLPAPPPELLPPPVRKVPLTKRPPAERRARAAAAEPVQRPAAPAPTGNPWGGGGGGAAGGPRRPAGRFRRMLRFVGVAAAVFFLIRVMAASPMVGLTLMGVLLAIALIIEWRRRR